MGVAVSRAGPADRLRVSGQPQLFTL